MKTVDFSQNSLLSATFPAKLGIGLTVGNLWAPRASVGMAGRRRIEWLKVSGFKPFCHFLAFRRCQSSCSTAGDMEVPARVSNASAWLDGNQNGAEAQLKSNRRRINGFGFQRNLRFVANRGCFRRKGNGHGGDEVQGSHSGLSVR